MSPYQAENCHAQHDNNLPPIISALGIWNTSKASGVYPLPVTHIPKGPREFHSSHLVSFRGYVALERLSCGKPLSANVKHQAGQIVLQPGKEAEAQKFIRIRVCDNVLNDMSLSKCLTSGIDQPRCSAHPRMHIRSWFLLSAHRICGLH